MTIICAITPRFELLIAAGGRREILAEPIALAPLPGGRQSIGTCSGAAEAHGIRAGMMLSEALSRCSELRLIPADPDLVERSWQRVLECLEGIGAEVESRAPGHAYFEADGLRGLWGGRIEDVLAQAKRALPLPARLGAGPSRFCSYIAARRPGSRRRPRIIVAGRERRYLASAPVSLLLGGLGEGPEARTLVVELERLGLGTLGSLVELGRDAVADRFGALGLRAWDLAQGQDTPLQPQRPSEQLLVRLELPEAAAGEQLDRALEMLIDRLLSDPVRRGRSIRTLRLEARLETGGSWLSPLALRRASTSRNHLALVLTPRLQQLPGPASRLGLRALSFGDDFADQASLGDAEAELQRLRLAEAIRQTRAACGNDAVMRVLELDRGSRAPERWMTLTPFPDPARPGDQP